MLKWRPINVTCEIKNVQVQIQPPLQGGDLPLQVHVYSISILSTEHDSTIQPKIYPFKDKASYDNWKSLFTSSRARRYEHSLPTVTLLGNYIFSRDITDFRREKFPIEDSRWMYINNKADVYIWSTTIKCKAKFWRSPTEIFNTPEAVIAFPRVQKKTDDKFSVIPVPADPHETG